MSGRYLRKGHALALLCGAVILFAPGASRAAQTRTWVVSWFTQAMYSQDGDCPNGFNPLIGEVYRRDLAAVGTPPAELEKIMAGMPANEPASVNAIVNRGRINGKPVNAYTHPASVPGVPQLVSQGRYAYGFNLDGKGAASPNGFEDPETHELGVNNQYARVTGCLMGYRAAPPIRPLWWELTWRTLRDGLPAWLISVTIDNDETGDVTIFIDKSLDHSNLDARGEARADATYRVDPDPQWHNVLHGKLKGDTLIVEGGQLHLRGDPYMIAIMRLHHLHLRLKFRADGGLEGILAGYQPWLDINFMYGSRGYPAESNLGVDMPSMYRALRDLADADPDPTNGRNASISTAYRVEAIPAFIVPANLAAMKGGANRGASLTASGFRPSEQTQ